MCTYKFEVRHKKVKKCQPILLSRHPIDDLEDFHDTFVSMQCPAHHCTSISSLIGPIFKEPKPVQETSSSHISPMLV
jgi:hypothetical protein